MDPVQRGSRLPSLGCMPAHALAVHRMDPYTILSVICFSTSNNKLYFVLPYYLLFARTLKVVAGETEGEDPGSGLHRVTVVCFSSRSPRRRHRSFVHSVRRGHKHGHNIKGYH